MADKLLKLTAEEAAVVRWLCLQYAAKEGAVVTPDMPDTKRIEAALVVAGRLS